MIQTIVVEDNMYMQKHLLSMLANDGKFHVVGTFRDAFEAESACVNNYIDLVLMDVQTQHNHSGLAAGKRIKTACKNTKVIVVTSLIDPDVLAKAKSGCADSLWYKDHGDEDIMNVIERTLKGEHVFPDSSPDIEFNDMRSAAITPRQMEILRRFSYGMTYEEIAAELKLTKNGVRWNLEQIMEQGNFQNKHELLAALIDNKLIVTMLKD